MRPGLLEPVSSRSRPKANTLCTRNRDVSSHIRSRLAHANNGQAVLSTSQSTWVKPIFWICRCRSQYSKISSNGTPQPNSHSGLSPPKGNTYLIEQPDKKLKSNGIKNYLSKIISRICPYHLFSYRRRIYLFKTSTQLQTQITVCHLDFRILF